MPRRSKNNLDMKPQTLRGAHWNNTAETWHEHNHKTVIIGLSIVWRWWRRVHLEIFAAQIDDKEQQGKPSV